MALQHARPGQVIDIRPLSDRLSASRTSTLIKTDSLEVIRLVLPKGKEIPPHRVSGEITVHCLEGKVAFRSESGEAELGSGDLLYLAGSEQHSVTALEDSSLLVTIVVRSKEV